MSVKAITKENFDQEVVKESKTVLLDFCLMTIFRFMIARG